MSKLRKGSFESDCLKGETDGLEGPGRWLCYDTAEIVYSEDEILPGTWVSTQDQDGGEGPQKDFDDLPKDMQDLIHEAVRQHEKKQK